MYPTSVLSVDIGEQVFNRCFSGLSSKVWFEAVSAKSASIKEWLTADNSSTNKRACETNESFDGNQMKDLDSNLHGNSNRVV